MISLITTKRFLPGADKRVPLGKGWSWKLPFTETENGKSYMNMADGGRYEIARNTLKGYDWEGITVKSVKASTKVSVRDRASDNTGRNIK